MSSAVVERWRPTRKVTLRGFASIRFPSGIIVNDISLHVSDGKPWVSVPAKPLLAADGSKILDRRGKPAFAPAISFANRVVHQAWTTAVLAALAEAHPEAFDDDQAAAA